MLAAGVPPQGALHPTRSAALQHRAAGVFKSLPCPSPAPQQRAAKQVLLLTGGVYLLSPLLHSLTRTISEDSVIAMTVGLLILHLYLHDYK